MSLQVNMKVRKDGIGVAIRNFNTRTVKNSAEIVKYCADEFVRLAKASCPVDTGKLKESIGNPSREGIYEVSPQGMAINVGTSVSYAIPVELGIKMPYEIEAWKKKALKFGTNPPIFAKKVVHPAMEGKFFMANAAIIAKQNTISYFGGR